ENGTVWQWSRGTYDKVPQLSGIVAVAAGDIHSLALGADGRVWVWGENYSGQLGLAESVRQQPTPTLLPGLTNVMAIAARSSHSLALLADGSVWAWGANYQGQLGIEPSEE